MCDIINSLKFASVTVWDIHSDVSLALLNNVYNVHQRVFVGLVNWTNTVLIAPDAGAIKKTLETSKALGLPMVRADKIRSVEDGSITGTTVYSEHIGDKDFLIVDDICDGGRTFVELAKVLRPLTNGKIYLYVTHGIFSKGLDVFNGLIDGVYTANPFPQVDLSNPILTLL
jgi:ribose-phosphate pyrophosphokinase